MAEQVAFRVEAAVAPAALAVCGVATLDTSPKAVRWGRVVHGNLARATDSPVALEDIPLIAELSEAVAVAARLAVVARCGADTACPKRQVPGTATLF